MSFSAGGASDKELEDFIMDRLTHGIPVNVDVTGGGCTAFVYTDEKGDTIYGRNFDFTYSPSLQVYTYPENAYASVSTVNLGFAGYGEDFYNLSELSGRIFAHRKTENVVK